MYDLRAILHFLENDSAIPATTCLRMLRYTFEYVMALVCMLKYTFVYTLPLHTELSPITRSCGACYIYSHLPVKKKYNRLV
jgi:hypothetical protein